MKTNQINSHWADFFIVSGVGLFAFALRSLYLSTFMDTVPTALTPLNDAKMYWGMGLKIYKEGWLLPDAGPFYQAPLYSYFLALFHHFSDHRLETVLRIQSLLGTINVTLCYAIGRQFLPKSRAAMGALLFSCCHLALFFESKVLAATLGLHLFLWFSLVFLLWIHRESIGYLVLSALLFSASILCRPNLLFIVPFLLLLFFVHDCQDKKPTLQFHKKSWIHAMLFFGIFLLGISPVPLRNGLVTGEWVPLTANSGVTLYMGTNPLAQGGLASIPGLSNNIEDQQFQSVTLAEKELGKELNYAESSSFWIKKTLKWVVNYPWQFLILEGKKLVWSVYYTPPAVNDSSHFEGRQITLLRVGSYFTLLALIGGLLAVPGLMKTRAGLFIVACWAGYILLSLVYYSSDRFLLTMLPMAAFGFFQWSYTSAGKFSRISFVSLRFLLWFFIVIALAGNPFLYKYRIQEMGLGHYNLGVFYEGRNQLDMAENEYKNALHYIPSHTSSLLNLGVLLAKQNSLENSTNLFKKVLELDPANETARKNMSINLNRMKSKN
jgi:tetratricopeptide (TPR) repeat protein